MTNSKMDNIPLQRQTKTAVATVRIDDPNQERTAEAVGVESAPTKTPVAKRRTTVSLAENIYLALCDRINQDRHAGTISTMAGLIEKALIDAGYNKDEETK